MHPRSRRARGLRARRLSIQRLERRNLLATLELVSAADNTLFEDTTGSVSNGAGDYFFVGRVAPRGGSEIRRGLIRFDLADLPANASINSVSVELNMSRTIAGSEPVSLHRVLADWGEAGSIATGSGQGRAVPAQTNDATWRHRNFPDTDWATLGGDFVQADSASVQVGGNGRYQWMSDQLATDVENWVANPAANFGWIVIGNELTNTTAKRFDSRENSTVANRPMLIIDFDISDTTSPTPTITGPASPTNSEPFDVAIAFGETVTGFAAGDLTVGNGSVANLVDNGGGDFTATIDAAGDGNVTVDIAAGVAADGAGNANLAATQFSVTVDTTSPAPSITGPASPTNSEPFDVAIAFGETVIGFVAGDITVSNGSVTNLLDNGGGDFTATIDASADGVVTVDVAAAVATDSAGNDNIAATTFSVTVDATGPTPTISGPAGPTQAEPFDVTITFAETVFFFAIGDITVGNGSVTNLVDNGGGNYTARIDASGDGEVTVDIPAGVATDVSGNPNSAAAQFAITIDTTGPTPLITGPASPTSRETFDVSIAFAESVTGFATDDITVGNGSLTNLVDMGEGNFSATITASAEGNVTVDIAAGVVDDVAGNASNAADQFSITVDTTAPTPTISGPASPAGGASFDVTIAFAEPVNDFVAADITVNNGSVSNLVDNGAGDFTATIVAASDGLVTVDLAAGIAEDSAGNANIAAAPFSITIDMTAPTPTISGPASPTSTETFDVTIAFGETVTGFDSADITVSNGSVTNLVDNGDGDFTATIDATADGTVTVDVAAGVATDAVGNDNNAATPFSVTVDTTRPSPVITGPASPTNAIPFDVTIAFGETVTGFDAGAITVGNGSVADVIDLGDGNFTAMIAATGDGVVTVDVAADVAADLAGNPNLAAATFSITFEAVHDFGDAPTSAQSGFANDYPVTLAQNGARHQVSALFLGNLVDAETDGQPTADADGDGDDDDGISLITSLVAAQTSTGSSLSVIASASGVLDAWIDFNRDGDWDDPGEQILTSKAAVASETVFPFSIPDDASAGETTARFRISRQLGLGPTGAADEGEVEDYLLTILSGDLSPDVTVNLVGDAVAISAESEDIVVRSGQTERFRAPSASVGSLTVVGTSGDDSFTLSLGSGFEIPAGGLQLDGGSGDNTLLIVGTDGSIDLSDPLVGASEINRVDLSSEDKTTLTLDAAAVAKFAASTKLLEIIAVEGDQIVVDQATNWRMTDPVVVDGQFHVTATHQEGEGEAIQVGLPHAWQNFLRPSDINNDGSVTALDALVIVNELGPQRFTQPGGDLLDPIDVPIWPGLYFDQNGDDRATALDALRVINRLAQETSSGQNSEGEIPPPSLRESASSQRKENDPIVEPSPSPAIVAFAGPEGSDATSVAVDSAPDESVADAPSAADVDELLADASFLSNRVTSWIRG